MHRTDLSGKLAPSLMFFNKGLPLFSLNPITPLENDEMNFVPNGSITILLNPKLSLIGLFIKFEKS